MSFILTRLNEPSDIVDIHYLALLDSAVHYLIVCRQQAIDIYNTNPDGSFALGRSIPILDIIIDIKPLRPLELPGTWLVVTTDSNRVLLIAFRDSINKDVVVEDYDLKEMGHFVSLEPGTLCVDSGKFLSSYTSEGSVCVFHLHRAKDLKNFAKALEPKSKAKQVLFKAPETFALTNMQGRTPIMVEAMDAHYEEGLEVTLSLLYRDDLYNYYSSYFTLEKNRMEQKHRLKLPEEMSSIILPVNQSLGTVLFGKSGIYLRGYPGMIAGVKTDHNLLNTKEGLFVETIEKDGKICFIKKGTLNQKTWNITAAHHIKKRPASNLTEIIFTSSDGHLFLTEIRTEVLQDEFGYPDQLLIKSWSLRRFPKKFMSVRRFAQLDEDTFATFSSTGGLNTFHINRTTMTFEVIQTKLFTPPILDLNIAGSAIPKVAVLGGSGMNDGLMRTEFKGFETEVKKIGNAKIDQGVTGIWKFEDTVIVNHLDGLQIFRTNGFELTPTDDFYGLSRVLGVILDLSMSYGELICVTNRGIYRNGETAADKLQQQIECASIPGSGKPAYVSGGLLRYKDQAYKLSEEVACIHVLEAARKAHILIGTWSGETILFVNGSAKTIHRLDLAVHSVLVKQVGSRIVYIIGGSDGSVIIVSGNDSVELSIGSAPVSIVDTNESALIVANKENVIRLVLGDQGQIENKGYLNIDLPEAISFDPLSGQIVILNSGCVGILNVSSNLSILQNEMPLKRLVRKATKFKNFLNLSLIVTATEKFNETLGRDVVVSQLEVIDNNTFKTKSIFRFEEAVEITDVVNTTYRKEIIDTYEEEKINMGFENILSQCFVVSCVYHMQDDTGPPLMLFSIDENGAIQHQCSSEPSKMSFYSLTNHANRLVVGAGNKICAFQIQFSMADSKFSLKRIAEPYKTRYYSCSVKSVGPDLIVGDIIKSPMRLKLKVKKDDDKSGSIFEFKEDKNELDSLHFLTSMEVYECLCITADSLKNIRVSLITTNSATTVSQFNICDQINVIKKLEGRGYRGTSHGELLKLLVDGNVTETTPDIVPLFVLGSIGGGLYLISLLTKADAVKVLEDTQEEIIRTKLKTLSKKKDGESMVERYVAMRSLRGVGHNFKPIMNFIDGTLITTFDDDIAKDLIEDNCVLL